MIGLQLLIMIHLSFYEIASLKYLMYLIRTKSLAMKSEALFEVLEILFELGQVHFIGDDHPRALG